MSSKFVMCAEDNETIGKGTRLIHSVHDITENKPENNDLNEK